MRRGLKSIITVGLLVVVAGLGVTSVLAVSTPNNSEQLVYSGAGPGTFGGTQTTVAFWVWCQSASSNPYGARCSGSVLIGTLGQSKGVTGFVSEPAEDSYLLQVWSSDGRLACNLTNVPPITSGPTNTVNVVCSTPDGSGMSTSAIVVVTEVDPVGNFPR